MSEQILDEWQIALKQKKSELESCQSEHQVKSTLVTIKFMCYKICWFPPRGKLTKV